MSTYDEAQAAKEKYKDLYWKKNPEKFNIISIETNVLLVDETDEASDLEIEDNFFIMAYLFDMTDIKTLELPQSMDGVFIKYAPVIEKD